ncbi:hypothetical protein JCM14469_14370 [Desulfatiferula olefinivorans]
MSAETYAANALGWTLLLCGVHTLIYLVPSVYAVIRGDFRSAFGWGIQTVITSVSLYMLYLGTTYRSSAEFVTWSKTTVVSSVMSLLLLPVVAIYQFWGLCLRYSLPDLSGMILAHLRRPIVVRPRLDWGVIRAMMVFGAPLMVFGYVSSHLWVAVERTVILGRLGNVELGLFAFASSLCLALVTVARSISQVFNPRIAMLYGSSGENMALTFRYSLRCSLTGAVVMFPLIAVTWVAIGPLLTMLLPRYVDCAPVVRGLCWLALVPVIDFPKQLLVVSKRTELFGLSVMSSFLLFVVFLGIRMQANDTLTLSDVVILSVACQLSSVLFGGVLAWNAARQFRMSLSSGSHRKED